MAKALGTHTLLGRVVALHRSNPNLSRQLTMHVEAVEQKQRELALAEESLREFINRHNLNKG